MCDYPLAWWEVTVIVAIITLAFITGLNLGRAAERIDQESRDLGR